MSKSRREYVKAYRVADMVAMMRNNKAEPRICTDSFSGKNVVITGATSGIGRRQAWALAQAGAAVVLLGRRENRLQDAVDEIRNVGGDAASLPALGPVKAKQGTSWPLARRGR